MTGGCRHKRKTLSEQKKAEVPVKSAATGKARAYAHKAKGIDGLASKCSVRELPRAPMAALMHQACRAQCGAA